MTVVATINRIKFCYRLYILREAHIVLHIQSLLLDQKSLKFNVVTLTFPSLFHCSGGSDHLRGENQIHCTPNKVSDGSQKRNCMIAQSCLRCQVFQCNLKKLLTLPAPAQSLQGFFPIPVHAWQP